MPNFQKFGDIYVDMELVASVVNVSSHAWSLRTVSGEEIAEISTATNWKGYEAMIKWLQEN